MFRFLTRSTCFDSTALAVLHRRIPAGASGSRTRSFNSFHPTPSTSYIETKSMHILVSLISMDPLRFVGTSH